MERFAFVAIVEVCGYVIPVELVDVWCDYDRMYGATFNDEVFVIRNEAAAVRAIRAAARKISAGTDEYRVAQKALQCLKERKKA